MHSSESYQLEHESLVRVDEPDVDEVVQYIERKMGHKTKRDDKVRMGVRERPRKKRAAQ